MQNFYLVRWLSENSGLDRDIIDSLKFELDSRIYYYGEQFASPFERGDLRITIDKAKFVLKEKILPIARNQTTPALPDSVKICSNAYFQFNQILSGNGYSVCPVPWESGALKAVDPELNSVVSKVKYVLRFGDFKDLISADFASDLSALRSSLKQYFVREDIKALVVPFDMPFFERFAIKVFKELGRPSIVALHGMPGRYNHIDDNRADYLLVWGDKIKDYYVRAGVNAAKILVTGHPGYSPNPQNALRFSLENVLVISRAMPGGQHSSGEVLSDRGNLILYLYSVRQVLKKLGVNRARLRLHPSESPLWYGRYLDSDFFEFDRDDLEVSLAKASLVIGPTSTVFLESLIAGVNYSIFEPAVDGINVINYPRVPPFDGTEAGIPSATTAMELERLLVKRISVDMGALAGFVKKPFDISFFNTLL